MRIELTDENKYIKFNDREEHNFKRFDQSKYPDARNNNNNQEPRLIYN